MTTNRFATLIEKAKKNSPLNAPLYGVDDALVSSAVENKLAAIGKLSASDLSSFIRSAIEQRSPLAIINQAELDTHASWLHDPANCFVKKGEVLNQLVVLDIPRYHSLVVLGNCFGAIRPDLTLKINTANYLIKLGQAVGITQPKIAVLAAVEVVYPQMAITRDGAVLAKMSDRGQIKGGLVDGPLSFDVAVDPEVAKGKGVTNSTVAGQAEGFLTPDSQTGRGIWEAQLKFSGAQAGSIILGGALPIIGVTPLDNRDTLLNSISLAHLLG